MLKLKTVGNVNIVLTATSCRTRDAVCHVPPQPTHHFSLLKLTWRLYVLSAVWHPLTSSSGKAWCTSFTTFHPLVTSRWLLEIWRWGRCDLNIKKVGGGSSSTVISAIQHMIIGSSSNFVLCHHESTNRKSRHYCRKFTHLQLAKQKLRGPLCLKQILPFWVSEVNFLTPQPLPPLHRRWNDQAARCPLSPRRASSWGLRKAQVSLSDPLQVGH